ncbi:MAG: glucose-6-phosphate isomerase [Rhodospirillales bacterium]|nr:glucose-6-phosphate isomerase [Rhodospirillales bacterium]MBO6788565.1 glucose-6-phosphate isomerase [Rhodospirillales bacterium]
MPLISETPAWKHLSQLRGELQGITLGDLFAADAERAAKLNVDLGDLYIDFSRQRVTPDVLAGLVALAGAADVPGFLKRMAAGEAVNTSEDRAALHTAVRGTEGADVRTDIDAADAAMQAFVAAVHAGEIASAGGQPFDAVLAIGIGGSELGPALALDALGDAAGMKLDVRMCANIDGIAFERATAGLDPATTLVVVISKSFRTMETGANAERAQAWMRRAVGENWAGNFAAVSANVDEVGQFGIAADRIFPMWDWVGGRYSLWSAVGLPVALAFGWDVFAELRAGAAEMDRHVLSAPATENAPILLALMTVWNTNFLGCGAEACVPYDTRLARLVGHLQQLEMESNGKRVTAEGYPVDYATQPVVFGGIGLNAQHAFFQQLHQGTAAPVDILLPARAPTGDEAQHDLLISSALAQADALAFGRENMAEPHRHYPGDRPSTVIVYGDLTARMLGKLIALYEHKTAAAAAIWGINPFDQWGVELGKEMGDAVLPMLGDADAAPPSLGPLIGAVNRMRGS